MKKLIILFLFSIFLSNTTFGQNQTEVTTADSTSIEVYVNKEGTLFLYNEKISLSELELFLKSTKLHNVKFATVFPAPKKLHSVLDNVQKLFDTYNIESLRYKDAEFKEPAWD